MREKQDTANDGPTNTMVNNNQQPSIQQLNERKQQILRLLGVNSVGLCRELRERDERNRQLYEKEIVRYETRLKECKLLLMMLTLCLFF